MEGVLLFIICVSTSHIRGTQYSRKVDHFNAFIMVAYAHRQRSILRWFMIITSLYIFGTLFLNIKQQFHQELKVEKSNTGK